VSLVFLTRFLVNRGYLVDLPIYSWIGTPTSQQDRCNLGDLGDQFLFIFVFVYVRISSLSHIRTIFCLFVCLFFNISKVLSCFFLVVVVVVVVVECLGRIYLQILTIGDLIYCKLYYRICSCRKQTGPKLEAGRVRQQSLYLSDLF
jgi:hypothetical protein